MNGPRQTIDLSNDGKEGIGQTGHFFLQFDGPVKSVV